MVGKRKLTTCYCEKGGHFAALEKPKELWGDVEEFVGIAWKG